MLAAAVCAGPRPRARTSSTSACSRRPASPRTACATRAPGIVVSASHNPFGDNGLKVFARDGSQARRGARGRDRVRRSTRLARRDDPAGPTGAASAPCASTDARAWYASSCSRRAGATPLDGLRVVVDCANGAASGIAPAVFARSVRPSRRSATTPTAATSTTGSARRRPRRSPTPSSRRARTSASRSTGTRTDASRSTRPAGCSTATGCSRCSRRTARGRHPRRRRRRDGDVEPRAAPHAARRGHRGRRGPGRRPARRRGARAHGLDARRRAVRPRRVRRPRDHRRRVLTGCCSPSSWRRAARSTCSPRACSRRCPQLLVNVEVADARRARRRRARLGVTWPHARASSGTGPRPASRVGDRAAASGSWSRPRTRRRCSASRTRCARACSTPSGPRKAPGSLPAMCGIIGVVGAEDALAILLPGLERLEYRGYDSAGVAIQLRRRHAVAVPRGRRHALGRGAQRAVRRRRPPGRRRGSATRAGRPTGAPDRAQRAPPGRLRRRRSRSSTTASWRTTPRSRSACAAAGHAYVSGTDTEVLAHLVEDHRARGLDLPDAVAAALREVTGAFSIAVVDAARPAWSSRPGACRRSSSGAPRRRPTSRATSPRSSSTRATSSRSRTTSSRSSPPAGLELRDLDGAPVAPTLARVELGRRDRRARAATPTS